MEIETIDAKNKLELNQNVFGVAYNQGLVHQAVVAYRNKARSGNSAQKTRSEVSGGGKKPWKQKGTGRARAGTIRSPIWRSGGVTFAAKKRDYSQKINRKMYKSAIKSILSELLRTDSVRFINGFSSETHKSKDFLSKMNEFKVESALVVVNGATANDYLASRNLVDFDVFDVSNSVVDPISLLRYQNLVITADAAKRIEEHLQ